jgi:hypothetical protein
VPCAKGVAGRVPSMAGRVPSMAGRVPSMAGRVPSTLVTSTFTMERLCLVPKV